MTVLAATSWRNNAAMIEACVELGYLKLDDLVLDATYGRGGWWTTWQPKDLRHDATVDFRAMPYPTNRFDVVCFDPPYVCTGGRETSTIPDFNDRYGLKDAPKTPWNLQALINLGLAECWRVTRLGGLVLVKVMDYVSSGKLWSGVWMTQNVAYELGFDVRDHLYHVGHARPQPAGRRQLHARQNVSHLLVLEK